MDPALPCSGRRVSLRIEGRTVQLRSIEPGDIDLERAFVAGLSRTTGYQRLMSARRPTEEEIRRWTWIDPRREGAVVAVVDGDGGPVQVGVARYAVVDEAGGAEFAIVIADAFQGKGLGAPLLSRLIDVARESGVRQLFGMTSAHNRGMRMLARRLGFVLSREGGADVVTMTSPLLSCFRGSH